MSKRIVEIVDVIRDRVLEREVAGYCNESGATFRKGVLRGRDKRLKIMSDETTKEEPQADNERLVRERLAAHKARQQAEIERKEKAKSKGRKQGNAKAKR